MKSSSPDTDNQPELCPVCGTPMVTEDGESYCPKCAAEIDWGLDDDETSEREE